MFPIKRQLTFNQTAGEQIKKFRKITCLEDLSNELFYEIFEYLDGCDLYQAFSNLNNRFRNLLTHSLLPLRVSLSSDSQSTLERRCRDVIIPNQHRLRSLHLSDDSFISDFFDQCHVDASFNRLESVILNEISKEKILVILFHLYSLPRLASLTIMLEEDCFYNLADIYRLIFRFPCLKYSKVSTPDSEESDISVPLSINQKPSTITHLILSFGCTLNELTSLISHTPHLQYLSCEHLLRTDEDEINSDETRLSLPHLTCLSIDNCDIDFDQFEVFIRKISSHLRKFCITVRWNLTHGYVDADRWKQLIKKHMPYLSEFHLEHHLLFDDDDDENNFPDDKSINPFTSSFWVERQWLFEVKYDFNEWISSIHPRRETWFNCPIDDLMIPYPKQFNYSEQSNNPFNLPISFTLGNYIPAGQVQSVINNIKFFSITLQFTHLSMKYQAIGIGQLIEIIRLLPNLHSLEISSLPLLQSNSLSSEESETLLSISINSKITKVKLNKTEEMEQIHFLFDLCPRMEYFEMDCKTEDELDNFVKSILMNNMAYIHHLQCLCICLPNANDQILENLKTMIDFEKRFHVDKIFTVYKLHRRGDKIYLTWKLHNK